jgi:hypothetical protein
MLIISPFDVTSIYNYLGCKLNYFYTIFNTFVTHGDANKFISITNVATQTMAWFKEDYTFLCFISRSLRRVCPIQVAANAECFYDSDCFGYCCRISREDNVWRFSCIGESCIVNNDSATVPLENTVILTINVLQIAMS